VPTEEREQAQIRGKKRKRLVGASWRGNPDGPKKKRGNKRVEKGGEEEMQV